MAYLAPQFSILMILKLSVVVLAWTRLELSYFLHDITESFTSLNSPDCHPAGHGTKQWVKFLWAMLVATSYQGDRKPNNFIITSRESTTCARPPFSLEKRGRVAVH